MIDLGDLSALDVGGLNDALARRYSIDADPWVGMSAVSSASPVMANMVPSQIADQAAHMRELMRPPKCDWKTIPGVREMTERQNALMRGGPFEEWDRLLRELRSKVDDLFRLSRESGWSDGIKRSMLPPPQICVTTTNCCLPLRWLSSSRLARYHSMEFPTAIPLSGS